MKNTKMTTTPRLEIGKDILLEKGEKLFTFRNKVNGEILYSSSKYEVVNRDGKNFIPIFNSRWRVGVIKERARSRYCTKCKSSACLSGCRGCGATHIATLQFLNGWLAKWIFCVW